MVIKVEGVQPSHPQAPETPAQPAVELHAWWIPLYRLKALQLALLGSYANFQPNDVIARAKAFEDYILNGSPEFPDATPTVQEQINAAFLNLTGNLDGTTGL
jgi:hypothetical protein